MYHHLLLMGSYIQVDRQINLSFYNNNDKNNDINMNNNYSILKKVLWTF